MQELLRLLVMGAGCGCVLALAMFTFAPEQDNKQRQPEKALLLEAMFVGTGSLAGIVGYGLGEKRRRNQPWKGWRSFVVHKKTKECEQIISFELKPVDGGVLPAYLAGQFVTLELNIPGKDESLQRTYSISDFALNKGSPHGYRITVKRQEAPRDSAVPPGQGSGYLHDHVDKGSQLNLLPPAGQFVFETKSTRPLVLVSNGVGITPVFSILKAALAADSARQVVFIHGCRNSDTQVFREELKRLDTTNSNMQLVLLYSQPKISDNELCKEKGRITAEVVQRYEPPDADYFLCGSRSLMTEIADSLRNRGIEERRIHCECFTPQKRFSTVKEDVGSRTRTVRFLPSGCSAKWTENNSQSILELGEDAGLKLRFGCRAGLCGSCSSTIVNGSVEYITPPSMSVAANQALICVARPASQFVEVKQ